MNTGISLPRVALIAGPTASGKTTVAIALAEQIGGTVINADASQVYRDLRVVTARPSAKDEARVPHRLFGYVDAARPYSAARWAADARVVVAETIAAGRLPILVGGSGLYLRTLIDGIAPVPDIDPAIRAAVRAMPVADAHAELRRVDSATATRVSSHDTARVARALEVHRATGRSLTAWQARREGGIGDQVTLAPLVMLPDRDMLLDRIDARCAAMLDEGAVAEVATLIARDDVPPGAPVSRAIGVAAITRMIAGEYDRARALQAMRAETHRYAKRQFTWFRHQPPQWWPRVDDVDLGNLKYYFRIWP